MRAITPSLTTATGVPAQARLNGVPGTRAEEQDFTHGVNTSAFTAVVETPAVQTPDDATEAPDAVVSVATKLVSAFISPFVAPGPAGPADPPLLWALLGWVRRGVRAA